MPRCLTGIQRLCFRRQRTGNEDVRGGESEKSQSHSTAPSAGPTESGKGKSALVTHVDKALLGDVAQTALEMATILGELFTPLKITLGFVNMFIERAQQYTENMEALDNIRNSLIRIGNLVLMTQPVESDAAEHKRCKDLTSALSNVADTILGYKTSPEGLLGATKSFLSAKTTSSVIKNCLVMIDEALYVFELSLQRDTYSMTKETRKDIRQLLNVSSDQESRDLLRMLPRANDAEFRANRPGCFDGTRIDIIKHLHEWVLDDGCAQRVFWLSGSASSGKSAIAQSFAAWLSKPVLSSRRTASFFCSRTTATRRDCAMVLPTLVHQLAVGAGLPDFREQLIKQLKTDGRSASLMSEEIEAQGQNLFVHPAASSNLTAIVVIDALDECEDKSQTKKLLHFLTRREILAQIPGVKVFIASRPEPHIRTTLYGSSGPGREGVRGFHLDRDCPKNSEVLQRDIEIFVASELAAIATELRQNSTDSSGDLNVPEDWPTKSDITSLVHMADGSFLFAATALNVLKNYRDTYINPITLLKNITTGNLRALDELYLNTLKSAFPQKPPGLENALQKVFGLLVVAREPLTLNTISGMTEGLGFVPSSILGELRSIVVVPTEPGNVVEFCHPSFLAFLTAPDLQKKKEEIGLSYAIITPNNHHLVAAKTCLELLCNETELKKNTFGRARYSSNGLPQGSEAPFSGAVKYACLHWADHLLELPFEPRNPNSLPFLELLSRFLVSKQRQRWLAVMCDLGALHRAEESLRMVRKLLLKSMPEDSHSLASEKLQTAIDAISRGQHTLLFAYHAIQESTSHFYHSALFWTPRHLQYTEAGDLAGEAKIIVDADTFWTANLQTIPMPGQISAVGYARSSRLLGVVGDRFTSLLHAGTGVELYGTTGQASQDGPQSIAFSADDTLFALAIGKRIQLSRISINESISSKPKLRLEAKVELQGARGDNDTVRYIAFHPKHNDTLLSVDGSGHLCIWDVSDGALPSHKTMEGVPIITFWEAVCWLENTEEKVVVVGTEGGFIKFWNATSGTARTASTSSPDTLKPPSREHEKSIRAVATCAYAAGALVAASSNHGIAIYDASNGSALHSLLFSSDSNIAVRSLAFPSEFCNGQDEFLMLTRDTGVDLYYPSRDYLGSLMESKVVSSALSPDGQFIVTGSESNRQTIQFWATRKGGCTAQDQEAYHTSRITFAHFSRDGKYIVYGLAGGGVQVWEIISDKSLKEAIFDKSLGEAISGKTPTLLKGTSTPGLEAFFLSTSGNDYIFSWDADKKRPDVVRWRPGHAKHLELSSAYDMGVSICEQYGTLLCYFPFDFLDQEERPGFFSIHREADGMCKFLCWQLSENKERTDTYALGLIAEGSMSTNGNSVVRIRTETTSTSETRLRIVVDCASGNQFTAIWPFLEALHEGNPHRLSFSKPKSEPNRSSSKHPDRSTTERGVLAPHEFYGFQSQDKAWILNERGTKILWIPPNRRGRARWWKKAKLLLEGESGRLTLLDFTGVALDTA